MRKSHFITPRRFDDTVLDPTAGAVEHYRPAISVWAEVAQLTLMVIMCVSLAFIGFGVYEWIVDGV
jgi:hypothetical protein